VAGFHKETSAADSLPALGKAGSIKNGKLDQGQGSTGTSPPCPQCGSAKVWKDGIRETGFGQVQRYLCRSCGYRFSDPNSKQLQRFFNGSGMSEHVETIHTKKLKSKTAILDYCRVSNELIERASTGQPRLVQNLAEVETRQGVAQREGTTQPSVSIEGEIIRYLVWLKNQAYSHHTIRSRANLLKGLVKMQADLNNPESVKETIANANNWSQTTKLLATTAYDSLLKWQGKTWIPPRYKQTQKLPFIPTEEELDALITISGKKLATMLQILKETGARLGEAFTLEWTDIDFERYTLRINHPEKGSNPRILPITKRLAGMISILPKKGPRIFGGGSLRTFETSFWNQRRKASVKLQNPRLKAITFHTLRHWKATMEYHKTHDIFHVQRLLGHKNIQNTAIYITLENSVFQTKDEDFHVAVAKTLEEACKLVEVGFEYVCGMSNAKIFRKRK
jgi:integrase/predicted RNA-binding Zn-ribbon protein involved in translation (DUF1610 family)